MQAPDQDNSILLVRAEPESFGGDRALDLAADRLRQCNGRVVAFFHGAGVDHARCSHAGPWIELACDHELVLEVCAAAWQRRHDDDLPEPFVRSSLVRFWHRVASGFCLFGPDACDGQ